MHGLNKSAITACLASTIRFGTRFRPRQDSRRDCFPGEVFTAHEIVRRRFGVLPGVPARKPGGYSAVIGVVAGISAMLRNTIAFAAALAACFFEPHGKVIPSE